MNNLRNQNRWRVKRDNEGIYHISGKRGNIYDYGTDELNVLLLSTALVPRIERSGWKALNHYDDGAMFIRPFADLDVACKLIKAGKRRVVTEAMREKGRALASRMRSGK